MTSIAIRPVEEMNNFVAAGGIRYQQVSGTQSFADDMRQVLAQRNTMSKQMPSRPGLAAKATQLTYN